MGSVRPALLAVVTFLLLFWSVFTPAVGQNPSGRMVVATDYELFGTSDLSGGGHVTWTLTGSKAADLRGKILHLFDEYGQIPRGFPFAGAATSANANGILEPTEGVQYTNRLENVLEGSGVTIGTQAQYMLLYPFDLREKDPNESIGFERSTLGLANTNLSTTANVEIRFLFQANTTTRDARVPLATPVLAESLYQVFSYEAAQSASLLPDPWPFLVESGWHVVNASGRAALWAGNLSTGTYDNSTVATTRTCTDPFLASGTCPDSVLTSPFGIYVPFDLRFASRASATFNYTGRVAGGDHLHLEIATAPPLFADWRPLLLLSGFDLLPTVMWSNVTVDLSSYLGQRVRLRWNFTSDGVGNDRGFFISDFALHAPASYAGDIVETDTHYLVGTLSFSGPELASGGIQLVRTPGGEILFYGSGWNASARPNDTMVFRTWAVTENPQVLFSIMLIGSYAISRLQESAYDRYVKAHPAEYRPAVRKAKWLHRLGKVGMALLIVFYFVPTATWFVGLRIFVSGPAYGLFAFTVVLLVGFGTRAYYKQRLVEAPPVVAGEEPIVVKKVVIPTSVIQENAAVAQCRHCLREIPQGEQAYRCTCGAVYHQSCAAGLTRCPNCRRPIAVDVGRDKTQVSLRCESCGEVQTVPEDTDPRAVTCANCGARLRHLDEGKRYLLVASSPAIAFAWLRDLTKGGKPALCMTSAAPDRLRLEFGVKNVAIIQVSGGASEALDPQNLDPSGLKEILPLVRQRNGGVILYDSLDQIIAEASIGDVIRFLRKANDMAFVHGVTVIARVSPGRLADQELKKLNAEFDEYLDLSAQF